MQPGLLTKEERDTHLRIRMECDWHFLFAPFGRHLAWDHNCQPAVFGTWFVLVISPLKGPL